jgi:hypothetical protein
MSSLLASVYAAAHGIEDQDANLRLDPIHGAGPSGSLLATGYRAGHEIGYDQDVYLGHGAPAMPPAVARFLAEHPDIAPDQARATATAAAHRALSFYDRMDPAEAAALGTREAFEANSVDAALLGLRSRTAAPQLRTDAPQPPRANLQEVIESAAAARVTPSAVPAAAVQPSPTVQPAPAFAASPSAPPATIERLEAEALALHGSGVPAGRSDAWRAAHAGSAALQADFAAPAHLVDYLTAVAEFGRLPGRGG